MINDSIVAEVRAAREQIFAECGNDLDQFEAHVRQATEQLKLEGWIMADRPNVRRNDASYSAKTESFVVREETPPEH